MHPIQAMTSGPEVQRLVARVRYGILTKEEAVGREGLTDKERKLLESLLKDEEDLEGE